MTISAFGAIAAFAGLEHGVGEVLQGNTTPSGVVIASWAGSAPFAKLQGEPAMTLIPNLLLSGILAIAAAIVLFIWVAVFIERKHGGAVLIALSIVLLLVGGGFAPPLLGIILGIAARGTGTPPAPRSDGLAVLLSNVWAASLALGVIAFLSLVPGIPMAAAVLGAGASPWIENAVMILTPAAFVLLILSLFAASAHDAQVGAQLSGQLR